MDPNSETHPPKKESPYAEILNANSIQMNNVLDNQGYFSKKIEFEGYIESKDPDTMCGIGCFKPRWLQPWATARVYLVLYAIIGIISGTYYSYLSGCMSTIEKRFSFKSKVSGIIMMVDEIMPLLLGVLVGYFGGRTHRPRMVAFGMSLSCMCCFLSALPYFIYGAATHLSTITPESVQKNDTGFEICDAEFQEENRKSYEGFTSMAPVFIFIFGSFLKGFGSLAYYAVGLAYMDDNSKRKNTPMYFAFASAMRLFGPLLGYLMSSFFLKYPENPFVDPEFERKDPRWIGGWWMGFLLQGFLLSIFTAPIALFPRKLPAQKGLEPSTKQSVEVRLGSEVRNILAALKRLGKNPLFIFVTLNSIMNIFGSFGHYIMSPRYVENQFRLSASEASLASGPLGIAAVIISMLAGGYLIYRFKPSKKVLTAGMALLEIISALGYLVMMIPQCEKTELSNFGMNNDGLILEDTCNINCNCSTSSFTPVCFPEENKLFFSPCHAGCKETDGKEFTNCSCIMPSSENERNYVTKGFCARKDCWPQALAYIITFPLIQIITSISKSAFTIVLLRSISPEDKSVALGVFEAMTSAFGFIPYPILFGTMADSTCLVRSHGKTGSCWFYDIQKFNYALHGTSALFSALQACCLVVICYLSAGLGDLYGDSKQTDAYTSQVNEGEVVAETDAVTKF